MGCIAIEQRKRQQKLTVLDYKIIWRKCLQLDSVQPHHTLKYIHPAFAQIAKDIDRTFPMHPLFQLGQTKISFQNILKQFALQFPKIGYTQGLNFVTGFFLIAGLDEKNTLNALIALCSNNDMMMLGLYQDDFPLCRLYCQLFWLVSKITNPEIYKLMKKAGLPDQLWLFQWFITLFIYSLPLSYISDIFNFIIVKRYFAPVRIAVAILQSLEKYLANVSAMKEDGLIQCFQLMKNQEFCKRYIPLQGILKRAQKIKKAMIMKCLEESQCHNWYKYYFLTVSPHRQKKYARFVNDLQIQRKRFQQQNCDDSSRYSRQPSSIQIIDNIEQTKMKRYSRVLSRSSRDKYQFGFSSLTDKKYNSVRQSN